MLPDDLAVRVRALSAAKALTIASYGESVASYRYRTLAERAANDVGRRVFTEMADEEQGHHLLVQRVLGAEYPDSDYVLSPDDKELVIAGPRIFELGTAESFSRALEMIYESECRTGRFYDALAQLPAFAPLSTQLAEMAVECFDHAERLRGLPQS